MSLALLLFCVLLVHLRVRRRVHCFDRARYRNPVSSLLRPDFVMSRGRGAGQYALAARVAVRFAVMAPTTQWLSLRQNRRCSMQHAGHALRRSPSPPSRAERRSQSCRAGRSHRSARRACGFNPGSARAPSRPLQGQGLLVSASPLCRGLPWWPPEMLRSTQSGGSFPAWPHGTRQGRRRSMSGAVSKLVRNGRAAQASSATRSAFIGRQWLPVCLPANGRALLLARYRRRSAEYP
jgi:hypothetical protein